jgi:hypothetical protein
VPWAGLGFLLCEWAASEASAGGTFVDEAESVPGIDWLLAFRSISGTPFLPTSLSSTIPIYHTP